MLLIACSLAFIVNNGGFGSFLSQRTFINKCVLLLMITSTLATTDLSGFAAKLLSAVAVASAILAIGGLILYLSTGITFTAEDLATYQYKDTPLGVLPRATALMPTTQSLAHLLRVGLSTLLFIPVRPVLRFAGVGLICVAISVTFSTVAVIAMAVVLAIWPFLRWPERTFHFLVVLIRRPPPCTSPVRSVGSTARSWFPSGPRVRWTGSDTCRLVSRRSGSIRCSESASNRSGDRSPR